MYTIFFFSMIVALSGALVPGPLLTYTIIKTLESTSRGYLTGFKVILGHAIIEGFLVTGILFGFSLILTRVSVVRVIGLIGGGFLIYMGTDILVKIKSRKFSTPFEKENKKENGSIMRISNPVLGGALISMSNPYWWIWWATIGFGFMLQYNLSIKNWLGLSIFFFGHETGDLLWYATVSSLIHLGKKKINRKLYTVLLGLCSAVILGFGVFLILKVILKPL